MLAAAEKNKKTNNSFLKLPFYQDDDLPNNLRSNLANRTLTENDKYIKKKKHIKPKYNSYETEYEKKSDTKNLKIPRLQNRKGNITLEDSNNLSNTKHNLSSQENKFQKKKSNNIINIVNNVNGNHDKNNKNIGLKVNINRYDIKCYIPPKKKHSKNQTMDGNTDCYNDSSKSSQEILINNHIEDSEYRSNNENINNENQNGINVDIINFSRKTTKKINEKQKEKEEKEIEKRIKRHILNKIKSLNNLYKIDLIDNRPKLNLESSDSSINEENPKILIKSYLSKEVKYNPDAFNKEDQIDLDNLFNDEEKRYLNKKSKLRLKNLSKYSKNGNNQLHENSDNVHYSNLYMTSNSNISEERFHLNLIDNTNKTINSLNEQTKTGRNNDNKKSNLDTNNLNDISLNSSNLNEYNIEEDESIDVSGKKMKKFKNKKYKEKNNNEIEVNENYVKEHINKKMKNIRRKTINENGEEITYSLIITETNENDKERREREGKTKS